jgi:hypothetical protein
MGVIPSGLGLEDEGSRWGLQYDSPTRTATARTSEPLLPTIFRQVICYQRPILPAALFRHRSFNSVLPRWLPPRSESIWYDTIPAVYVLQGFESQRRMIIWGPQVTGLFGNKVKCQPDLGP